MSALHRIAQLILSPRAAWEAIASERTSVDALVLRYIVPLSLLAPISTTIGMRTFDRDWDSRHGYLVPPELIFTAGATTLFATIGSIFALAAIFRALAPMYGSSRDFVAALKVATYGAVPVLLAGATLFLPIMVLVSLVALCHTLYLFWLGANRVLNVGRDHQTEFIGIALVLLGAVSVLVGGAASSLGWI